MHKAPALRPLLLAKVFAKVLLALALIAALPAPAAEEQEPRPPRAKAPPASEGAKKKTPRMEGDTITLTVGDSQKLSVPGGTQIVCDNPEVASADLAGDSPAIRGNKPGTTTCGARLGGMPKGVWTVTVLEAEK